MSKFPPLNEQMDVIKHNVVDLLPENELVKKIEHSIKNNKPLNIKFGADPSRPDLHIGHAVVLHKMRQFQDLGHTAILIIGDFTAMIGDPTGKSKTRPQLTLEDTKINGQTYLDQANLILSKERFEVVHNSQWLNTMNFAQVINLSAHYTVAQLLERDDFSKRYKSGTPISIHELLYPLAQAMDSVEINSDVELGGTEQKFNLLVGREIQRAYGKEPQCIITMPILEGTDGKEKMSKSLDNYIALTDTPKDIFGKVMSIPDNLILKYFQYAGLSNSDEIKKMQKQLNSDGFNPRNAKVETAIKIVDIYNTKGSGQEAYEEFQRIFKKKELPDIIDELKLSYQNNEPGILEIIADAKMCQSKKEARRMLEQGAVSIDGDKMSDPTQKIDISKKRLFKVGKRKFLYISAS